MKETFYGIVGAIGAAIASLFGGWTAALSTLCIFMALDYVTGFIVAGIFHASKKTEEGGLSSAVGWKGIFRKAMTLAIVFLGTRIDLLIGASYVRDGLCIAFIVNESVSIIENAGLMGVPIPDVLTKAIEILREQSDNTNQK